MESRLLAVACAPNIDSTQSITRIFALTLFIKGTPWSIPGMHVKPFGSGKKWKKWFVRKRLIIVDLFEGMKLWSGHIFAAIELQPWPGHLTKNNWQCHPLPLFIAASMIPHMRYSSSSCMQHSPIYFIHVRRLFFFLQPVCVIVIHLCVFPPNYSSALLLLFPRSQYRQNNTP